MILAFDTVETILASSDLLRSFCQYVPTDTGRAGGLTSLPDLYRAKRNQFRRILNTQTSSPQLLFLVSFPQLIASVILGSPREIPILLSNFQTQSSRFKRRGSGSEWRMTKRDFLDEVRSWIRANGD